VYRENRVPKLPNLKKAALVIFLYSLIFTSLVSFLPDDHPGQDQARILQNLIGGLAMNLSGPYVARLVFQVFVVAVGTLILSGAVNTAIIVPTASSIAFPRTAFSLIGFAGRIHDSEPHTGSLISCDVSTAE